MLTTFHIEKIRIDIFVDNADMAGGILPRIGLHSGASAHAGANVNVALEKLDPEYDPELDSEQPDPDSNPDHEQVNMLMKKLNCRCQRRRRSLCL